MIKKNFDYIRRITEAHGPAGSEEEVREIIREELTGVADSFDYDNLGSIICRLNDKATGPKVAMIGHMDEVGFLVQSITSNGYLKLFKMGGIDPVIALGASATIKNRYGKKVEGVIFTEGSTKDLTIENLLVDIGAKSRDEVTELGFSIGDSVAFKRETKFLGDKNVVAKSWDDRVGCILGMEIMKKLKNEKLDMDLYFIGSVQEEVGTRGGKTSVNKLNPDIVIVLDVATGKKETRIYGEGPCIVVADKLALGNKKILNHFEEIAKSENIKYQLDFLAGGGTDNGPATLSGAGVPGLAIIIPVKNCHTPNTIINVEDFENCFKLLYNGIKNINDELMKKIYDYKI